MIRKLMLCLIVFLAISVFSETEAATKTDQMIEVFDVNDNDVIMNIHLNQAIQYDVKNILVGIDGIVKKVNPIPNDGMIVKIPIEPNVMVENEWLNDLIDEVMIFYSKKDYPYLLTFDQENNPYFFTFKGDA